MTSSALASILSEAASPVGNDLLVIEDLSQVDEGSTTRLATLRSAVRVGIDRSGALPTIATESFDLLLTTHPAPRREWTHVAANRLDGAVRAIEAQVHACPNAASIFCQTLRLGETMTPSDALILESLAYSTLLRGAEFERWLAARPRGEKATPCRPPLLIERQEHDLRIVIDRAETNNAMSAEVRDALVEALRQAGLDSSLRQVVLSGAGRSFSTGGELAEFGTTTDASLAHAVRVARSVAAEIFSLGQRIEVIAHGACIGAGVETMAAASRVSVQGPAFFQLPEIRMGLIPGAGGTVTLPRRIGRWRTAWMALSGKRIGREDALAWGLVDRLIG